MNHRLRLAAACMTVALALGGCTATTSPPQASEVGAGASALPAASEPGTFSAGQVVVFANGSALTVPNSGRVILVSRGALVTTPLVQSPVQGGRVSLESKGPEGLIFVHASNSDYSRDPSRLQQEYAKGSSSSPALVRSQATLSDGSKLTAYTRAYPGGRYGLAIFIEPPSRDPLRFQVYVSGSQPGFTGAAPQELPQRFLQLVGFKPAGP